MHICEPVGFTFLFYPNLQKFNSGLPFGVPELLARIRVALRLSMAADDEAIFISGSLEIDFAAHVVKLNKEEIRLTDTEYRLLSLLAKNAGKLMTQRQLLKEIWGISAIEHTHYLRIYVAQLRHKLEKDPSRPQMIITEPGVGYRMSILE
jgi:two-component system, OmpR family, KDP operon response regulator KdpE